MRIIFDLRRVGLGDNGGSSTIVRSANTLVDLGHQVYIIDSGPNKHTWTILRAKHLRVKNQNQVPDADVVIATGYKSVGATLQLPERCGKKFHWIRGWETWQMPEKTIVEKVLKKPTVKIVNGIGLQKKLKSYGVKSHIVRPGYDLNDYYPKHIRENLRQTIVLGGLFNLKHSRIKRHDWVVNAAGNLKKKYNGLRLWMFGADKKPDNPIVDRYLQKPEIHEKNNFYNGVDIWLAPTMQEGLHMPPAEAMLTECPVVGTNAPLSGMKDYLINEETGLVSQNNFESFLGNVKRLAGDRDLRTDLGKRARNKIIEIGDRKKNMNLMTKLFGELL